jgi:hypothetical protein
VEVRVGFVCEWWAEVGFGLDAVKRLGGLACVCRGARARVCK